MIADIAVLVAQVVIQDFQEFLDIRVKGHLDTQVNQDIVAEAAIQEPLAQVVIQVKVKAVIVGSAVIAGLLAIVACLDILAIRGNQDIVGSLEALAYHDIRGSQVKAVGLGILG